MYILYPFGYIYNNQIEMSVITSKSSFSPKLTLSTKEEILSWVEATGGTVFVPEGRKHPDGYIYSGVFNKTLGYRVDKDKVVPTLGEYLDLLEKHGRKYEYYQIIKLSELYLVPSHTYTLTKFLRNHFPDKFEKMGKPEKVKFNTYKWDFRVYSKTDHITKNRIIFEIPNEISKILIGKGGAVNKDFFAKTACSFTIKFNHKTRRTFLILCADESKVVSASEVMRTMIRSAIDTGTIPAIPSLLFPKLKKPVPLTS